MKNRLLIPVMIRRLLLITLLSFFVVNAFAINLMFMSKQAPARKFSDEDWKYFDNAIIHTLKYVNDGASYNWNNPASSASGTLEVLESTTKDNVHCRRVRLPTTYAQLKGVTEFVFCKQADGGWKVTQ